jgi:hypothetical protein
MLRAVAVTITLAIHTNACYCCYCCYCHCFMQGLEDSLDECIDESMRTLDQMCFSSQYYMMMTIAVNGIIYFVLGVQMMVRQRYNMWADPVLLLILPFVAAVAHLCCRACVWLALRLNLWKIKHENTAWHSNVEEDDDFDIPDMGDLHGAGHDAYMMNQRITSETFRYTQCSDRF